MPVYTDQLNREIDIPALPKRIISLVPSQTELLYDLGLEKEVVGITKFCIHPEKWFRTKTRVGGTKTLHLDKIKALQPDLIIANKEENVREQIESLACEYPVWISDVNNLDEALTMIEQIAAITSKIEEGQVLAQQVQMAFSHYKASLTAPLRTCYLIWKDPYMTVGGDTFIHSILSYAGFTNIFASATRYPEVSITTLRELNCELVLLSSEPYPFKQQHRDELQVLLPNTKILLVDGEVFSWYGSRLLHTPAYLQQLQTRIIHTS